MNSTKPLAEILRPLNFDDYIGQEHLIGEKGILRRSIDAGNTPSMILWGPPGVGKTTLAFILSQNLEVPFYSLSAINAGVKAVREVIEKASTSGRKSVLFLDEIHRFSKSQQDSLLGAVETGTVTLIGATTENPSFEVISPLLSRSQVYILKSLEEKHLLQLVVRAKTYYSEALNMDLVFSETAALFRVSGGDARKLYNAIELVVGTFGTQIKKIEFTDALVSELMVNG